MKIEHPLNPIQDRDSARDPQSSSVIASSGANVLLDSNISTYSISELNKIVARLLTDSFPLIWVSGEISNFSSPSKHWYFSLKDSEAQVRCAFFHAQSRCPSLSLKEGLQVMALARVRLYETRGEFQLVIERIEAMGEGQLRQSFEQLKVKLAKEGLFDSVHKKALPRFPKRIGVITSPTGAVIQDIITVLKRRFPSIAILIYPSLVQGTEAADQIVNKIKLANRRAECDVLVLARGGGSLEDLWPFNEERVARAIYESQLPIISAIGHESDVTISDFVADVRAPTPSAASELLSPHQMELHALLNDMKQRVWRAISIRLKLAQQQLDLLQHRLRDPGQRLQDLTQRLDELEQRLLRAWKQRLSSQKQQLTSLSEALEMISPFSILARGYALVKHYSTHKAVASPHHVSPGDSVIIQLAEGELQCVVQRVSFES